MKRRLSRINEGVIEDLGAQARKLLDIPVIKSITGFFTGEEGEESPESEQEREKLSKDISDLESEMIPLSTALQANKVKRGLIVGSSQAGIIGPAVMRNLESRGFKDFNYGASPAKSMRFIYTSVATAVRDKQNYDVVVIFPGYRIGETPETVIDLINLFSPGRCFVVVPPPVTSVVDVFEAARLGLNKGNAIPVDYWFVLRGGEYAREREDYCAQLKDAVERAGATAVDPRDVVAGGTLQVSGVSFPDSPDGIHVSRGTAEEIAKAVSDQIFSSSKMVPAAEVVSKISPSDLDRDPRIVSLFSSFPATAAILNTYVGSSDRGDFGMRMHPVYKEMRPHHGIDISAPTGTPVRAALDGVVVYTGEDDVGSGGNIKIEHENGDKTRYLHLSKIIAKQGQTVKKGDVIGLSGGQPGTKGAGTSTGPHLHWETNVGGNVIDPFDWLAANTDAVKPIEFEARG